MGLFSSLNHDTNIHKSTRKQFFSWINCF